MPKHPCIKIIKDAAGEGIVSDQQAQEMIDGILKQAEANQDTRLSSIEDRIKGVGKDLLDDTKMQNALQRRNALLAIKARRQRINYVKRFKTLGKGFEAYMNGSDKRTPGGRMGVWPQINRLEHAYTSQLLEGLTNANLLKEFSNGTLEREIFTELWSMGDPSLKNPSGSPEAMKIAQVIRGVHNTMIPRENRAGGFIRMLDNYVMRQTHDPVRIRKAGGMGFGTDSAAASYRTWSEFILPLLDNEKTFRGVTDKGAWLKNVHQNILSGVHGKSNAQALAEFRGVGSLAKKVSGKRVLHFKDADSAFVYNKEFGSRNFRDGIIGDMRRSAQATALMENFGPNPEIEFDIFMRQMREMAAASPDDAKQLKSLDNPFLRHFFDGLTGEIDNPASTMLHKITQGARAQVILSKAGAITISAMADMPLMHMAGTYQGWGQMDALWANIDSFIPKGKQDRRLALLAMDAATDSWLGNIAGRFTGDGNFGGVMYKVQQNMFKINGMAWWDKIHKGTFAQHTSNWLGLHANKGFDAIPEGIRHNLKLFSIDELEWDAMRKTVFKVENGHQYVTPDQLRNIPDETIASLVKADGDPPSADNMLRKRDSLNSKLGAYILEQVEDASPTPGNRERVMASWGTRSGTIQGTAARTIMMFKSFPMTVWERVVKREMFGRGATSAGDWLMHPSKGGYRMAQLVAMTTISGYISMSIKDAIKGRTPRSLVNPDGSVNKKVLLASMQRGGGLGIYGDMLFNEYDRSYNNFWDVAMGPTLGQASELAALTTSAIKGEDVKGSAGKLAINNAPYANLFYIRPALDYIILWNIQEALDPGTLRRMERSVEKKNNQGFFIRPSEAIR